MVGGVMFSKGLRDNLSKTIINDIYRQYLDSRDANQNESVKPLIRVYIISLAMLVSYWKESKLIEEIFYKLKDQNLSSDEFYKWMFSSRKKCFECRVLPLCLLKDLCGGDFSKVNTAGRARDILREVSLTCDTIGYDSTEALQIAAKYGVSSEILPNLLMDRIDDIPEYLDCNSVLLTGDINTEKLTKIFRDNLEIVAFAAKKKLDAVNKVQPSKENIW